MTKRTFPPGTFIATPARVMAILQLCFAFSLLLWILSQPFMGDLYTVRSRELIYETVLGQKELANPGQQERNLKRASLLDKQARSVLENDYTALKAELQQPFQEKITRALELLFLRISPWELAWILLGIIIPIMLLKRVEGAAAASWLLVLVVLVFALDNRMNAPVRVNHEIQLYPTEAYLETHYFTEALNSSITEQQRQYTLAWKRYLIDQWAKQLPSKDPSEFQLQLEEGEFAFNLARIHAMDNLSQDLSIGYKPHQLSLITLGLYIFWNLLFVLIVRRHSSSIEPAFKP